MTLALNFRNRVRFATETTGIGPIAAGLPTLYFQPLSAVSDGLTIPYTIIDNLIPGQWEAGHGVVGGSGTTLTRAPVSSSNPGNAAVFLSGDSTVFLDLLAADVLAAPNNLAELPSPAAARANLLAGYVSAVPAGKTLSAADSGTVQSDAGASAKTTFALPAWSQSLVFPFLCETTHGIHITLKGTDTLTNGGDASTAGGSMTSGSDTSGTGTLAGFTCTVIAGAVSGKWYFLPGALGLWTAA